MWRGTLFPTVLFLLAPAAPAEPPPSLWLAEKVETRFRGTIDGKYRIRMRLRRDGTRVTGSYEYEGKGGPLRLDGTVDETDRGTLKETDAQGKQTGKLDAFFTSPATVRGSWSPPDRPGELPFYVEREQTPADRASPAGPFQGSWVLESKSLSFTLDLAGDGTKVVGSYSAVTLPKASRVDSDAPMEGTVRSGQARVTFTSAYSGKSGTAVMSARGKELRWQVVKEPDGEYWAPRKATLRRVYR